MSRPRLVKQRTTRFTESQEAFILKAAAKKPEMDPAELIRTGALALAAQRLGKNP